MTVILVLSRNTVTSHAHRGTIPHRRLDCFYSNTNKFVQIEDTKIKAEHGCEMQRTERTRVLHHSIAAAVPTRFLTPRDFLLRCP